MKVGDMVKYVPTHLEQSSPAWRVELGIIIGVTDDGWYFDVYWTKVGEVVCYTRESLEVISESR